MAIDPKNRPVRVINDDTTDQELAAGHIIPGGDPPKNEDARGGFGNREGREGYGTDTANGITALGENRNADSTTLPPIIFFPTTRAATGKPMRTCLIRTSSTTTRP
ncbi:hypothetical protein [Hymenobacter volaticus]|uniref:Uncharacterized protein n=1 Tax=Hymenobacter volaticus TaxID=2932254 RepID=A0ABY4G5T2_9BACT|nr:hypothetical protein [Hymenobacter volaticus]UOQ66238.1 hypothetical protein MUN86_22545 [Hymenobacter volaticus]